MDPFAVPRATFELSMRLATLPFEIGAKMLGARNDDEPGEERPPRSTPSRRRSSASTRSRSQTSTRKRDGGQTKRRSTRSTQQRRRSQTEAAKRTMRSDGERKSQRRSSGASSPRKTQRQRNGASSERQAQRAASPGRTDVPVATPEPATPSDAAVVAAHIEPAPHIWSPTPAAPEPPTPTDAAIAAALRGTAEVQEGAEAAAQAATQGSSVTETPRRASSGLVGDRGSRRAGSRARGGRRPEHPL